MHNENVYEYMKSLSDFVTLPLHFVVIESFIPRFLSVYRIFCSLLCMPGGSSYPHLDPFCPAAGSTI